ncbi:MAG: proton-conducting membrane transporter [Blautia sp.]|nr:proton-conducting membrane transporter [Blautia sp.]
MSSLFLLLPVLFPIAGAFLLFFLHFPDTDDSKRNRYTEVVVCLTSVLVWISMAFVSKQPVKIYSFVRGFSISLGLDGLGRLFAGMISVMWPLVTWYAFVYMEHAREKSKFFAFYTMTYGVSLGIAFSSNMTTLYVFFEMLTLVTIPLVSHYKNHDSMFAGRKYAAYTIGGAGLGFFAVVMTTLYGDAGNFVFGGSLNGGGTATGLMQTAFLFGFFGFGAKAAVFPLHGWLPTASVAPTPVTALLHAVAVVNSGVFAVTRLTWYIYGPEALEGTYVQITALLVSVFTLVFAAVMALRERHFKRRLAWSTVSNLSYMLFGISLLTTQGFVGGTMHMLFHGIIKMSLFLCAGAFMHVTCNEYIYEVNGAGRRMPLTFLFYTLGGLSLTGIPMFCGFISKWNLVMAGLQADTPWSLAGVAGLIIAAFLCAMYTLTVSVRAFFPSAGTDRYEGEQGIREAEKEMLVPIAVFGVINIVLGIWSAPVTEFLSKIAAGLL